MYFFSPQSLESIVGNFPEKILIVFLGHSNNHEIKGGKKTKPQHHNSVQIKLDFFHFWFSCTYSNNPLQPPIVTKINDYEIMV